MELFIQFNINTLNYLCTHESMPIEFYRSFYGKIDWVNIMDLPEEIIDEFPNYYNWNNLNLIMYSDTFLIKHKNKIIETPNFYIFVYFLVVKSAF